MRIYISADAEGCPYVNGFSEVEPGNEGYENTCVQMEKLAEAAIKGARSGGADYILLSDGHEDGTNIKHTTADEFVRGTGRLSMMNGIDGGFDAAFFIGYHSRRDSLGAMPHTYFKKAVRAVYFDGRPVGELEINAALAAYFGVKTALICGDACFVSQSLKNGVVGVVTKKGEAINENVYAELEKAAEKAVNDGELYEVPNDIKVEFTDGETRFFGGGSYEELFVSMIDKMRKKEAGLSKAL